MTGLTPLSALSSLDPLGGASQSSQPATAAPATPSGPAWLNGELAKVVTILLGLILIIAGLFSFRSVRETVVVAGKAAASAA